MDSGDKLGQEAFTATWTIVAAAGLALTVAAIVMVGSRWYPARFNDAYWLYITSGGTLDAFSVVTIGMLALGVALIARSSPRLRGYAVACFILTVLVLAIYAGLLSSLPSVMREASENTFTARTVRYGIVRASLTAALASGLYLWFALTSWKRASRASR